MSLAHYIIVRRDLPFGVVCAMITHAAGESGALYQDPYDGRFRGATAVVLGVRDEKELNRVMFRLMDKNIQHIRVYESDDPYTGQFMAIGVVPTEREIVSQPLRELQLLKELKELA